MAVFHLVDNYPHIVFKDIEGLIRSSYGIGLKNTPFLIMNDKKDNNRIFLGLNDKDDSSIHLRDSKNHQRIGLYLNKDDDMPSFFIFNEKEISNLRIKSDGSSTEMVIFDINKERDKYLSLFSSYQGQIGLKVISMGKIVIDMENDKNGFSEFKIFDKEGNEKIKLPYK